MQTTIGQRPSLIALDQLRVDDGYQRPLQRLHVAKIVAEWDHTLFGTPLVGSRTDGTLWVVDGRQRCAAARELGFTHAYATTFDSKGPEHEAAVFDMANASRRKVQPVDRHRANVLAGDPIALSMERILREYDLTCLPSQDPRRQVAAVGAVRKVFEQYAQADMAMRWTLRALLPVLGRRPAREVYIGPLVGALVELASTYADTVDADDVAKVLEHQDLVALSRKINTRGHGATWALYAETLADTINSLVNVPLFADID